jgi:hypothetical protein
MALGAGNAALRAPHGYRVRGAGRVAGMTRIFSRVPVGPFLGGRKTEHRWGNDDCSRGACWGYMGVAAAMKVFYDTEFLEDGKAIELISR